MPEIPIRYRLFSAKESGLLDSFSINSLDISGQTLMEVAGAKASDYILKNCDIQDRAVILCGKGNNAGDALVTIRHLMRHGISAMIFFISGKDDLSPETQKNLEILSALSGLKIPADIEIRTSWNVNAASEYRANFIIDGMLGTGLSSDLKGDYAKAVSWANESSLPVFSMDIPTGLNADSGHIMGISISATATFAFGTLKTGYYLEKGPQQCGDIHFCDLGFPDSLQSATHRYLIRPEWINRYTLPEKHPRHKYEAGILYVIAGSEGLTGAAVMAAWSAWAEGPGAVIAIVPRGLEPALEQHLIQQVKKPVGSKKDLFFKKEHASDVLKIIGERPGTILLGPGLGRHPETVEFVQTILQQNLNPLVMDADGLWCLSQLEKIPDHPESEWIITPHPGELHRLLNSDFKNDHERMQKVDRYAANQHLYVVSKGNPVIVADPRHNLYLTDYDTTIFSRSGYGDVLSGKIAATWSMGQDPTISCLSSLLKGKDKYDQIMSNQSDHPPEPLDLI